mmetsp:Transcript_31361/g.94219  ORF Transcript_31361/g.94219 Transcript_31361/m.94219 type:complete len:346 (+) Transcript_31361:458-1495(+)
MCTHSSHVARRAPRKGLAPSSSPVKDSVHRVWFIISMVCNVCTAIRFKLKIAISSLKRIQISRRSRRWQARFGAPVQRGAFQVTEPAFGIHNPHRQFLVASGPRSLQDVIHLDDKCVVSKAHVVQLVHQRNEVVQIRLGKSALGHVRKLVITVSGYDFSQYSTRFALRYERCALSTDAGPYQHHTERSGIPLLRVAFAEPGDCRQLIATERLALEIANARSPGARLGRRSKSTAHVHRVGEIQLFAFGQLQLPGNDLFGSMDGGRRIFGQPRKVKIAMAVKHANELALVQVLRQIDVDEDDVVCVPLCQSRCAANGDVLDCKRPRRTAAMHEIPTIVWVVAPFHA